MAYRRQPEPESVRGFQVKQREALKWLSLRSAAILPRRMSEAQRGCGAPLPLSSALGTKKTVKAGFWPRLEPFQYRRL